MLRRRRRLPVCRNPGMRQRRHLERSDATFMCLKPVEHLLATGAAATTRANVARRKAFSCMVVNRSSHLVV